MSLHVHYWRRWCCRWWWSAPKLLQIPILIHSWRYLEAKKKNLLTAFKVLKVQPTNFFQRSLAQTGTRAINGCTWTRQFEPDTIPSWLQSLHDELSAATHWLICHCDSPLYNIIQKHTWIPMRFPLTTYCRAHWWVLIENQFQSAVEPPRWASPEPEYSPGGQKQARKNQPWWGKLQHSQVEYIFFSCLFFIEASIFPYAVKLVNSLFLCVCTGLCTCLGSCEHLLTACLSAHQNRVCSHTYGPSTSKAGMQ